MRYAIHVPNFGDYADPRALAELAQEAEAAGWDGFFLWDHLLARPEGDVPVADPWIALAAIAAVTTRIRLGPLVTPLPRRRPWKLAREAVTLDHLSKGRLVLGVGIGTPVEADFAPFGEPTDARERAQLLDEGLEIVTGLWSGEPFRHNGQRYRLNEVTFLPRPVQRPRIPIWVGGAWPHRGPMRRAAHWDGVFPDKAGIDWERGEIMTPDDLREILAYIRTQRTAAGPFDVILGGMTDGPAQGAEKLAPYEEAGLTWWIEGLHSMRGSFAEMRKRIHAGPPRPAGPELGTRTYRRPLI